MIESRCIRCTLVHATKEIKVITTMNNEDVSQRSKCLIMNVSTGAVAFAVFLCFSTLHANLWTTKQSMVNTRRFPAVGVVNNILYAIGGDGVTVNEAFDPVNNSWTAKAPLPTIRYWGCAAGTVAGKIYVIGGATGGFYLDTNEEYDPGGDSWTSVAVMPTPRCGLAIGVAYDSIYAIGGFNGAPLATNEAYDPVTDTWTTKTPMPTARSYPAVAVVNNKIYAIGGYNSAMGGFLTTVEEYDPVTDSWQTMTGMPTARNEHAAATLNGRIYAIGGWDGASDLVVKEEYDPVGNSW
ncbi:MAG: hypothetical protein E3J78_08155, partial [Candidatus Cloacimonadota bacterium]